MRKKQHSLPIYIDTLSPPSIPPKVVSLTRFTYHSFLQIENFISSLLYFFKMGRENSDQAVVHSSIALLQERFRQLQRVKEMREERELLRLFSSSSDSERSISPTSTACNVPPSNKLFYHPELIIPPRPTFQSFHHFLCTESRGDHADYLGNDQKGNTDFFAVDQIRNTDFFCVDEKRNTDFFSVDQKRKADFLAGDTPLLMSLWPTDRSITRNSNTFDDSDVDTSLHL